MTEERKNKIKAAAEKKFPYEYDNKSWWTSKNLTDFERLAYIDGATPYATKLEEAEKEIASLRESLKKIIELKKAASSTQDLFPVLQEIDKAKIDNNL